MLPLVPSATPTYLIAKAISPNIINTTWEPPTAYHLGGVITAYTLTYRGIERDTPLKVKILSVLNGSIYITPALTDLQEDTRYVISVRANTSVGAGPWTSLTVHTPEDGEFYLFLIRIVFQVEVISDYLAFQTLLTKVYLLLLLTSSSIDVLIIEILIYKWYKAMIDRFEWSG